MHSSAVLFDVDGTLLDTNYFHVLAWWRSFQAEGIDVSMAFLQERIGMGSDKMTREGAGPDRGGLHERLNRRHGENFARFKTETRAFPDAARLLREVAAGGAGVWLATSAKPEEVDHITAVLAAGDAITGVVSSGDVERSKPDPDTFLEAMRRSGAAPGRTVAVGDSPWDVEAARGAGISCVCVRTGGYARQVLQEAGAAAVYADVAELRRSLAESPLARLLELR